MKTSKKISRTKSILDSKKSKRYDIGYTIMFAGYLFVRLNQIWSTQIEKRGLSSTYM